MSQSKVCYGRVPITWATNEKGKPLEYVVKLNKDGAPVPHHQIPHGVCMLYYTEQIRGVDDHPVEVSFCGRTYVRAPLPIVRHVAVACVIDLESRQIFYQYSMCRESAQPKAKESRWSRTTHRWTALQRLFRSPLVMPFPTGIKLDDEANLTFDLSRRHHRSPDKVKNDPQSVAQVSKYIRKQLARRRCCVREVDGWTPV